MSKANNQNYRVEKLIIPMDEKRNTIHFSLQNMKIIFILNNEIVQKTFGITNIFILETLVKKNQEEKVIKLNFNNLNNTNIFNKQDLNFILSILDTAEENNISIFNLCKKNNVDYQNLNELVNILCLEYMIQKDLKCKTMPILKYQSKKF